MRLCGRAIHRPRLRAAALAICAFAGMAVAAPSAPASVLSWGGRIGVEGQPGIPDNTYSLRSISCTTQHLCAAGDNAGSVITTTNPDGGAAAWHRQNFDASRVMGAVSCLPALCVAVDYSGYAFHTTNPTASLCVAVDQSNAENILSTTTPTSDGAWKAASVGTGTFEELFGVSCASTSLCTAVDDGGRAFTSIKPTGSPSDWKRDLADGRWGFYGVSCSPTAPPLCVGVDQAGNVVLGHLRPPDTLITQSTIKPSKGTASFGFKGVGVVSGFQCELKKKGSSASFSACHSPKAYNHLKAGSYTFLVRALNSSGPDPQPAQRTFKIAKPPNTRITKTKIDSSKGTASFSFKSIGSASSFQCELKQKRAKATFSHCKSPKTYKHLAAGNYTFLVRAVNSTARDHTPAKKSF